MKIGLFSHHPDWATGFGVTAGKIALSLSKLGHEVVCVGFAFGIVSSKEGEENSRPYRIWNGSLEKMEAYGVGEFLEQEKPDIIFLNFDIAAVIYFLSLLKFNQYNKKIYAHSVLDGFPVSPSFLAFVRELDAMIVPTRASLKYLKREGLTNIHYAPHGVNTKEFFPLDKHAIRSRQGFDTQFRNKFIIGAFAKNDERKQLPKIFMAVQHLVFELKQKDVLLYVHAEVKPNLGTGWDLEFLADWLKIKKHVIFTEKSFLPQIGVGLAPSGDADRRKPLSYLERINMCDVIVNVPFSGGFELCNVEAQACGVPVITTDDGGNIKEVVNDSAILLKPKMKSVWTNGAIVHLIDEVDLAHALLRVKCDPLLRQNLREKGLENIKRYSWRLLEKKIDTLVNN